MVPLNHKYPEVLISCALRINLGQYQPLESGVSISGSCAGVLSVTDMEEVALGHEMRVGAPIGNLLYINYSTIKLCDFM